MGSQGCIRAQSTRRGSTRRENGYSSLARDGLAECRTPNRYDPSRHYRHFRVQIPSDPRDVRKTITPKTPLFKRGGRIDVVTPKASMPLTRALGATRIASPHISPRAAMIAQDFARVRVLGAFSRGARGGHPSQEKRRKHSHALWCSDHVRARGQKCPQAAPVARPHRARARPAQLASRDIFQMCD